MTSAVTSHLSRLLQADHSLLLIVDIQEKLLPAMENPDKLIEKALILLQACDQLKVPIVVSEQVPHKLGPTADVLTRSLPPEATTLHKASFGCGQEPEILALLEARNRRQIILCGMESHVCVNQTAHQLLEAGHQVHLVTDAVQSRNKRDHNGAR